MSTKTDVLDVVRRSDEPLRPSEIATRLGLGYERTKKCMQRMARAGELHTDGTGRYSARVPRSTSGTTARLESSCCESTGKTRHHRRACAHVFGDARDTSTLHIAEIQESVDHRTPPAAFSPRRNCAEV